MLDPVLSLKAQLPRAMRAARLLVGLRDGARDGAPQGRQLDELIPHELEHVVEHIEGIDVTRNVSKYGTGAYERAAATSRPSAPRGRAARPETSSTPPRARSALLTRR